MAEKDLTEVVRIVDDDPKVLASESFLVQMLGWQTACFSSAEDFLEKNDSLHPGCLILDVRMPGISGLELQDRLEEKDWDLPIIFLTGHGDINMAVHAIQSGAADFLEKPPTPDRLKASIEKALRKSRTMRAERKERNRILKLFSELTPREKTVVPLIAEGLGNKEAAKRLGISENAVKTNRSNVMEKLGVQTSVQVHQLIQKVGVPT